MSGFPFAAVVGMDWAKQALMLLAIDPTLKGVLIAAGPGTAKSVLARAFWSLVEWRNADGEWPMANGELINPQSAIRNPQFIEVPLSVTEDRLLGGLDLERTIITGRPVVNQGLLAEAHAGVLYVDQINLLPPRLARHIASALSSGVVSLEREGLSATISSDFMFIGTYDPDEGDVSPALLDCVGMHVALFEGNSKFQAPNSKQIGIGDFPRSGWGLGISREAGGDWGFPAKRVEERVELVTRVMAQGHDACAFTARYLAETSRLRKLITEARSRLPRVEIRSEDQRRLALLAWQLGVEGHRADIFALRVARAVAAFNGRRLVQEDDLQVALELALIPRAASDYWSVVPGPLRGNPKFQIPNPKQIQNPKSKIQNPKGQGPTDGGQRTTDETEDLLLPPLDCPLPDDLLNPWSLVPFGEIPNSKSQIPNKSKIQNPKSKIQRDKNQRTKDIRGRYVGAVADKSGLGKIALDATLRAAAPHQKGRRRSADTRPKTRHSNDECRMMNDELKPHSLIYSSFIIHRSSLVLNSEPALAVKITKDDLRWKRFKQKAGRLIVFVVDASGSMAQGRMNQAKGAVIRLLQDAYRRRDKVALISFRGCRADVLLPPSRSVELARRALDAQPVGGGTPLAAGLLTALDLVKRSRRSGIRQTMLILLTDGRANVALRNDERSIRGKSQIPNPKSQTNPKSKIQNPKSKDVHHSALSTQRPVIWEELQLICAALRGESVVSLVIDTQHRFTSGGQTQAIAELLDGRHIYLPRPDVNAVYTAVATLANDP